MKRTTKTTIAILLSIGAAFNASADVHNLDDKRIPVPQELYDTEEGHLLDKDGNMYAITPVAENGIDSIRYAECNYPIDYTDNYDATKFFEFNENNPRCVLKQFEIKENNLTDEEKASIKKSLSMEAQAQ